MSGPLLSIRRQTLEGERLVGLAESTAVDRKAVALQDGTLMLGTLEGLGVGAMAARQSVALAARAIRTNAPPPPAAGSLYEPPKARRGGERLASARLSLAAGRLPARLYRRR